MDNGIFSEEFAVVESARKRLKSGEEIAREDYISLMDAYEKLLNQTIHITNISDMLGKNLNQYKHELLSKVNVDDLTNVSNRRHLLALLEHYLGECARMGNWISAIMIDIDYFKNYNDRYGHLAGDVCLKKVAMAVSKSVRHASDFVARYGGEEFYIVLPYTPIAGAKSVATRLVQSIAALKIPHADSSISEYVTVSMGLTSVIATPDIKIVNLLKTCDMALYEAKAAGRNNIVIRGIGIPAPVSQQ